MQLEKYIDLQVNGYRGIDFNQPNQSVDALRCAAAAMREEGVERALPTVITNSLESMCNCLSNLRRAIEQEPICGDVFAGLHIEGPFLSPKPGYIGAHPQQFAMSSDVSALDRLLDAGGDYVRLCTLAPEVDVDGRLTRLLSQRSVLVSAGHTDCSLSELDKCIEAGLGYFTHLGNACPPELPRHENILVRALRRADRLRFTVIADGFHIPQTLFENLLHWIPLERLAVVSDAISAAGLGPGTYQLAGRQVQIGPDKAARDSSGHHFVGSACSMRDADHWLAESLQIDEVTRRRLLYENPQSWLGCS